MGPDGRAWKLGRRVARGWIEGKGCLSSLCPDGLTCINCNSTTSGAKPVCAVQLIQYQSLAHQVLKCSCGCPN
jgi:hypothetical protein